MQGQLCSKGQKFSKETLFLIRINHFTQFSNEKKARMYGAGLLQGKIRVQAPLTPAIFHQFGTYFIWTSLICRHRVVLALHINWKK
jgi:hypothetical protein